MRRRPNRSLSEDQRQAADRFISGADGPPSTPGEGDLVGEDAYPWEQPGVREDVKQTYPLRLPEPLHLKLKYVSEEAGRSMNELCNAAIRTLVEKKLDDLT